MVDANLWRCRECDNVIAPEFEFADPEEQGQECPACGLRTGFVDIGGVSR